MEGHKKFVFNVQFPYGICNSRCRFEVKRSNVKVTKSLKSENQMCRNQWWKVDIFELGESVVTVNAACRMSSRRRVYHIHGKCTKIANGQPEELQTLWIW